MVGAKTVRACDSCLNKRASFYCKADDAFLCQTCDVSVHSANQVARRHERIRLNRAAVSWKKSNSLLGSAELDSIGSAPAWHRGFTRKARSTRKAAARTRVDDNISSLPIVPEISNEEDVDVDDEDDDERLLYQVPVFDPFGHVDNDFDIELNSMLMGRDGNEKFDIEEEENRDDDDLKNLDRLLETDMDLAEFAADVESLLGKGMDEDDGSGWIKGLGLFEQCKKEPDSITIEDDIDQSQLDVLGNDLIDQPQLEISVPKLESNSKDCNTPIVGTKNKLLRLNHEAVIAAWSPETSPWADGKRPVYNLEDFVDSIFEGSSSSLNQTYGGIHMGNVRINNEGREARVSRYREKRRTRLFSKKIRYEVRKINAEKRPRMKGRFVKRTPTFAGSSPYNTYLVLNNNKSP